LFVWLYRGSAPGRRHWSSQRLASNAYTAGIFRWQRYRSRSAALVIVKSRVEYLTEVLALSEVIPLLAPDGCALLLIDHQAGLAFGVGSTDRQLLLSNTVALARTAINFKLPVVVSTSASKVYSGPLMPPIQAVLPGIKSIERRNMNVWEDEAVRKAVSATGCHRLLVSGLLTEACVSFAVLSALAADYEVFVVGDACGGLTGVSHELALRRMEAAGARATSWIQVLLELQRDWTRHETYDGSRNIVETHGGGYGIGLAYARDMIRPT
jgi:nicotinamidase-related amidase